MKSQTIAKHWDLNKRNSVGLKFSLEPWLDVTLALICRLNPDTFRLFFVKCLSLRFLMFYLQFGIKPWFLGGWGLAFIIVYSRKVPCESSSNVNTFSAFPRNIFPHQSASGSWTAWVKPHWCSIVQIIQRPCVNSVINFFFLLYLLHIRWCGAILGWRTFSIWELTPVLFAQVHPDIISTSPHFDPWRCFFFKNSKFDSVFQVGPDSIPSYDPQHDDLGCFVTHQSQNLSSNDLNAVDVFLFLEGVAMGKMEVWNPMFGCFDMYGCFGNQYDEIKGSNAFASNEGNQPCQIAKMSNDECFYFGFLSWLFVAIASGITAIITPRIFPRTRWRVEAWEMGRGQWWERIVVIEAYVTFMARQVRWSAIIFWTTLDMCLGQLDHAHGKWVTLAGCRIMPILAQAKWLVRPEYSRYSSSIHWRCTSFFFSFLCHGWASHPRHWHGHCHGTGCCSAAQSGRVVQRARHWNWGWPGLHVHQSCRSSSWSWKSCGGRLVFCAGERPERLGSHDPPGRSLFRGGVSASGCTSALLFSTSSCSFGPSNQSQNCPVGVYEGCIIRGSACQLQPPALCHRACLSGCSSSDRWRAWRASGFCGEGGGQVGEGHSAECHSHLGWVADLLQPT